MALLKILPWRCKMCRARLRRVGGLVCQFGVQPMWVWLRSFSSGSITFPEVMMKKTSAMHRVLQCAVFTWGAHADVAPPT